MAYQLRQALGATSPLGVNDYLTKILGVLGQMKGLAEDPYLVEGACMITQLHAIETKKPVPTCARTPGGRTGGIGLRKAVPVFRAYVYAEQHPWVKPVAVAAAVGVPFLLGYLVGRRR